MRHIIFRLAVRQINGQYNIIEQLIFHMCQCIQLCLYVSVIIEYQAVSFSVIWRMHCEKWYEMLHDDLEIVWWNPNEGVISTNFLVIFVGVSPDNFWTVRLHFAWFYVVYYYIQNTQNDFPWFSINANSFNNSNNCLCKNSAS